MDEKTNPQGKDPNSSGQKEVPPCKHENTKQERIRGMPTGDHICLDCGKLI
jgi:hypothetical protein